ncbi:MAG: hypothetical protein ACOWWM_10060 [Desulfobacterales bacterium]
MDGIHRDLHRRSPSRPRHENTEALFPSKCNGFGRVVQCGRGAFRLESSASRFSGVKSLLIQAAVVLSVIWMLPPSPSSAAGTTLRMKAGVREEYNDNIFFTSRDKENDVITTGIIGGDFKRETERLTTELGAEFRPFWYFDNEDLNDVNFKADAGVKYRLTPRFTVDAEGSYDIDNRPDRDVDETGLSQATERRDRQRYRGGFLHQLSEKTQIFASGSHESTDYRQGLEDEDYDIWGGSGGIAHQFSAFAKPTIGRITGGYARFEYETSRTDYYFLNLGVTRNLTETLVLSLDAGPSFSDSEFEIRRPVLDPGPPPNILTAIETETDSSWGGSGRLSLVDERDVFRWELAVSHDLAAGAGQGQTVDRTQAEFDIRRRWHWAFMTGLNVRYFLNRSSTDHPELTEIDERTFLVRPMLRFFFTEDFFLEAAYSYTHQDDREQDVTRERSQVFLEFRYVPVLWE